MIPLKDDYVKIIMKNSLRLEGFVEFWGNRKIVLRSSDSDNTLVIHHPKEVLVTVIVKSYQSPKVVEKVHRELEQTFNEAAQELSPLEPSEDEHEKLSNLAQLRMALNNQERKIIENKLKTFDNLGPQKVTYGLPSIFNKNSSSE